MPARELQPPGESSAGTSAQGSVAEVFSSSAELQLHEKKMFAHLDEEKVRDIGTWVLDTGAMNHMSRCQAVFTKIDMAVLDTVLFGDHSVARIEAAGLSCLCVRTASPDPSTESTSSLVSRPTS
jgi:hypothetical protein